jgi:hypothetical protein
MGSQLALSSCPYATLRTYTAACYASHHRLPTDSLHQLMYATSTHACKTSKLADAAALLADFLTMGTR